MSSMMYPLALIGRQRVQQHARVVADGFEDGSSSARAMWPAQFFKRRFELQHAPLNTTEIEYLLGFNVARHGQYDSFWYRDNLNRAGNASVRFAGPLQIDADSAVVRNVQITLDEVAPVRALPRLTELIMAAGSTPAFWLDANRETYFEHLGAVYTDATIWDGSLNGIAPTWQSGALGLGNVTGQYQYYDLNGSRWAKYATNLAAFTGTQPACTLFAITRSPTCSTREVLFALGNTATGEALGLELNTSNDYTPFLGGSETWSTAKFTNSAASTWRSLGLTWVASGNAAKLYVNAAAALTETNTRALATSHPLALAGSPTGTLLASSDLAHVIGWAGELTAAQIKSVHNLLAHQYGLSLVA